MQKQILKKIGIIFLLLTLILSIFTIVSVAKNGDPDDFDCDGDPDDYGCCPVGMNCGGNCPLGKPIHKGTVRDTDFE